jgi:hypothetical protein
VPLLRRDRAKRFRAVPDDDVTALHFDNSNGLWPLRELESVFPSRNVRTSATTSSVLLSGAAVVRSLNGIDASAGGLGHVASLLPEELVSHT